MNEFLKPIPDAIREGKDAFLFDSGPPTINLKDRTMSAPVELSEHTRQVQLRELGHAKWSPERMQVAGINQMILEACEHARINTLLKASSFNLNSRMLNDADIEYIVTHGDVGRAAHMVLSSVNSADSKEVKRVFKKRYGSLYGSIIRAAHPVSYGSPQATEPWFKTLNWEATVEAAKRVEELLREFMENMEDLANQPPPQPQPAQPTDEEISEALRLPPAGEGVRWTPMEIEEPPRPITMPFNLKARKTIKSETGAVPIAIHRATIDGRVFRAKRRKPASGSVLIDQSGSMSMTVEDVEEIMEHLPGVVIAGYSSTQKKGFLRVIARGGKRVEKNMLMLRPDHNGCDGPALKWLAQQPGPRFWVSDGQITAIPAEGGSEQMCGPDLRREVRDTVLNHRILRVEDASSLTLRLARAKLRA